MCIMYTRTTYMRSKMPLANCVHANIGMARRATAVTVEARL